jgi:hypothetical protein
VAAVPIPRPISNTFLFFHNEKFANSNICGSTKCFFLSTSSKYYFEPTSFVE